MSDERDVIQWIDEAGDYPATAPVAGDAIVVLPVAVVEGRGRFPAEVSTLAKSLRDGGVDASYSHGADHREWIQLLGDAELAFAVAVAAEMLGSGAWDIVRAALESWIRDLALARPRMRVDLRVDRGDQSSWLRLSGSADHVVEALERIPEVVNAIQPEDRAAKLDHDGDESD